MGINLRLDPEGDVKHTLALSVIEAYSDGCCDLQYCFDELRSFGFSKTQIKVLLKREDLFDEEEWGYLFS